MSRERAFPRIGLEVRPVKHAKGGPGRIPRRLTGGNASRRAPAGEAAGCRGPGRGVADHRVPRCERPCRQRRVGKALADRVHKAAADLGYTANLQPRAVATGQSTMIGVALRDIADPYFSSIAAGLIEVATASGHFVCMSSTAASEDAEREYVALMRAQRARAVVLVGSRSDDKAARAARARNSPRSPAPAGGRPASGRTSSAWTRCSRRTGRRGSPRPGARRPRAPAVRCPRRAAHAAEPGGTGPRASSTGCAPRPWPAAPARRLPAARHRAPAADAARRDRGPPGPVRGRAAAAARRPGPGRGGAAAEHAASPAAPPLTRPPAMWAPGLGTLARAGPIR